MFSGINWVGPVFFEGVNTLRYNIFAVLLAASFLLATPVFAQQPVYSLSADRLCNLGWRDVGNCPWPFVSSEQERLAPINMREMAGFFFGDLVLPRLLDRELAKATNSLAGTKASASFNVGLMLPMADFRFDFGEAQLLQDERPMAIENSDSAIYATFRLRFH